MVNEQKKGPTCHSGVAYMSVRYVDAEDYPCDLLDGFLGHKETKSL